MIQLLRTDYGHPDFVELVRQLDAALAVENGEQHSFYNQYNGIDTIRHVVVAYQDGVAVACGAFKELEPQAVEVKRMYTLPGLRGKGLATAVLGELERWAVELGYPRCVLETGLNLPAAVALYERRGYRRIANYGQYIGVANSVCFEKAVVAG